MATVLSKVRCYGVEPEILGTYNPVTVKSRRSHRVVVTVPAQYHKHVKAGKYTAHRVGDALVYTPVKPIEAQRMTETEEEGFKKDWEYISGCIKLDDIGLKNQKLILTLTAVLRPDHILVDYGSAKLAWLDLGLCIFVPRVSGFTIATMIHLLSGTEPPEHLPYHSLRAKFLIENKPDKLTVLYSI